MSFVSRCLRPVLSRFLAAAALAAGLLAVPAAGWPGEAWANSRGEVRRLIEDEAARTAVPVSLALAIAKVESDFREKYEGPDGARGAMGVPPGAAPGHFGHEPEEMWHARPNARVALELLESLLDRHHGRWVPAVAQYGARRHRADPEALLREPAVDGYVRAVLFWQDEFASEAERVALAGRRGEALLALGRIPPAGHAGRHDAGAGGIVREEDRSAPGRADRWIAPGGSEVRVWQPPARWPAPHHARAPGRGLLDPELERRLAQARRTLDDFGPIERRRLPARGW